MVLLSLLSDGGDSSLATTGGGASANASMNDQFPSRFGPAEKT